MKLISMTDFVLEQNEIRLEKINKGEIDDSIIAGIEADNFFAFIVSNYAKFLKQPLELWMFVPCDENGNVLEKPNAGMFGYDHVYSNYDKAKERVLFEGFEMYCENACTNNEISVVFTKSGGILLDKNYETYVENIGHIIFIEDLTNYNLTLTQNAIKQL